MSLCYQSAGELARRIATRDLSAREVVDAHLDRIARVNPVVNAICTLDEDGARRRAAELDDAIVRGGPVGVLHGLPIAVKDLSPVRGMRTTFGSPIYQNFVPEADALFVRRLRAAGAVVLGKTNTPEFGAGSQTFNAVFGETRNPWDLSRTCGGSSGGAAVALTCGMLPLADGSDMGGSLRNPASFCNVVGFRPSPGRVANDTSELAWLPLSVLGPMARTVADVGLMLSVMAGQDPRDPISLDTPGERFRAPLDRDFDDVRLAWTPDLGHLPVDAEVVRVCETALSTFTDLGCRISLDAPDLRDGHETFQVLRAWSFAHSYAKDVAASRALVKDTIVWNVEKGLTLTAAQVARAEAARVALARRVVAFLEDYEYLLLPVVQVPPFPLSERWVREIDGVRMATYIDWMASCYLITLAGLPAISVPCGFTGNGLPVGLQIVGRRHADFEVLRFAHAFEQATEVGRQRPGEI